LKWIKKEGAKQDAPAQIEEMAGHLLIMALKEEAKNTEEAALTGERRKPIENIGVLKQLIK